jgi:hypothetical protein
MGAYQGEAMKTKPILALLTLLILALACGIPSTPEPPTATTAPPTDTPLPVPTPTDTPIPDPTAPSPLPMTHTGIILNDDECFDLDDGASPYVLDADCDILLVYPQILRPQNGAQLSGQATFEAPSRGDCAAAVFDPGDLAPNTDLYICFLSDEGHYGFIVQRPDGAPFDIASHRLVFDWWVYE